MDKINPEDPLNKMGLNPLSPEQRKAKDKEALLQAALLGDLQAFISGASDQIAKSYQAPNPKSFLQGPGPVNPNDLTPAQIANLLAACAGFVANLQVSTSNAQLGLAKTNAEVAQGISDGLQKIAAQIAQEIQQQEAQAAQANAWGIVGTVFSWIVAAVALVIDPAAGILMIAMNLMTQIKVNGQSGAEWFCSRLATGLQDMGIPADVAAIMSDVIVIAIVIAATLATGGGSAATAAADEVPAAAASAIQKIMSALRAAIGRVMQAVADAPSLAGKIFNFLAKSGAELLPSGRTAIAIASASNGLSMTHLFSDATNFYVDNQCNGDPNKKEELAAIASATQAAVAAFLAIVGGAGLAVNGGTVGSSLKEVLGKVTNYLQENMPNFTSFINQWKQFVETLANFTQSTANTVAGGYGIAQAKVGMDKANAEASSLLLRSVQSTLDGLEQDLMNHFNDLSKAETKIGNDIVTSIVQTTQAYEEIWKSVG